MIKIERIIWFALLGTIFTRSAPSRP